MNSQEDVTLLRKQADPISCQNEILQMLEHFFCYGGNFKLQDFRCQSRTLGYLSEIGRGIGGGGGRGVLENRRGSQFFETFKKEGLTGRGAGVAQWWEHSPPTTVVQGSIPDAASRVGWVCWSDCNERFFSGYYSFPLSSKTKIWFDLIWVNFISVPN